MLLAGIAARAFFDGRIAARRRGKLKQLSLEKPPVLIQGQLS